MNDLKDKLERRRDVKYLTIVNVSNGNIALAPSASAEHSDNEHNNTIIKTTTNNNDRNDHNDHNDEINNIESEIGVKRGSSHICDDLTSDRMSKISTSPRSTGNATCGSVSASPIHRADSTNAAAAAAPTSASNAQKSGRVANRFADAEFPPAPPAKARSSVPLSVYGPH